MTDLFTDQSLPPSREPLVHVVAVRLVPPLAAQHTQDQGGGRVDHERQQQERTQGERHPDYAGSLNNLTGLYRSMGRHAEAKALLSE